MTTFDSPEQEAFVRKEMARSYASGAWEKGDCNLYVSRLFCVVKAPAPPTPEYPEGEPRRRLVLDLRPLNLWCRQHKLKMESLKSLAAMGLEP